MKKLYIILSAWFFLTGSQQIIYAEKYTSDFLNIGVDARALGMGSAYCAYSENVSSFFWNPAGLGRVRQIQISGMYGPQFGSLQNPLGLFHYIGIALPLQGDAVFALNWVRLKVDDIPVYGELQGQSYWDRLHNISLRPSGDPSGYIADTEDALFFSFAKMNAFKWDLGWEFHKVSVEIPFGINVKWIRQTLGKGEASGLGVDIGTAFRIQLNEFFQYKPLGILSLGMCAKDVTKSRLNWNTDEKSQEEINRSFRWGLSYLHQIPAINGFVTVTSDWAMMNHQNYSYLGLEAGFYQLLHLRMGVCQSKPTFGAGISLWRFTADYAFLSHELNNLHRLSCSLKF